MPLPETDHPDLMGSIFDYTELSENALGWKVLDEYSGPMPVAGQTVRYEVTRPVEVDGGDEVYLGETVRAQLGLEPSSFWVEGEVVGTGTFLDSPTIYVALSDIDLRKAVDDLVNSKGSGRIFFIFDREKKSIVLDENNDQNQIGCPHPELINPDQQGTRCLVERLILAYENVQIVNLNDVRTAQ